jgi:serine/threonine-protein kinase
VRLLLPIVDALAKAHRRGIVHRDLKPENILLALTDEGVRPKLIDFGVAKLLGVNDPYATAAGTVLGSPGYLAPEQAKGLPAGPAADVWGLCIVLYEMVTGHMAFDGDEPLALIAAVVGQPHRSIVELGLEDRELSDVIDRGMRKAPGERWGSMEELGGALAAWLLSRGVAEDAYGMSVERIWLRRSSAPPPPEHWEHALRSDSAAGSASAVDWDSALRLELPASLRPDEQPSPLTDGLVEPPDDGPDEPQAPPTRERCAEPAAADPLPLAAASAEAPSSPQLARAWPWLGAAAVTTLVPWMLSLVLSMSAHGSGAPASAGRRTEPTGTTVDAGPSPTADRPAVPDESARDPGFRAIRAPIADAPPGLPTGTVEEGPAARGATRSGAPVPGQRSSRLGWLSELEPNPYRH